MVDLLVFYAWPVNEGGVESAVVVPAGPFDDGELGFVAVAEAVLVHTRSEEPNLQ